MLYLLPFMLVEAAGQGGDGLEMAAQEIHAVMQVRRAERLLVYPIHYETTLAVHCMFPTSQREGIAVPPMSRG